MYYVYTLADPRDNDIFYVGITNDINTRFQAHMRLLENNAEKNARIRGLQEESMAPRMEVIETASDEITALEREKCWIDHFNQQGIQLTNIRKLKKGTRGQYSSAPWKDCYTAPEASKVLGVSVHVFRKWVREGKFSPLSFFPLLQQPVSPQSQIDNYARNLKALQQPYNMELYYTASEASAVLEVSTYVFRRLVGEGTIKKIVLPDRKEGG